ncbi:MAG: DUF4430 domain-containing protein [Clostridiales bacterium]|nr:DUF4430 domain-containing protein [Clostridiales bacterium]
MKRNKALFIRLLAALLAFAFAALASACEKPKVKDNYAHHCTLYVDCRTLLDNMDDLDPDKRELVPEDGVILAQVTVGFDDGDSVYDILVRELRSRDIHIDASFVPAYNTAYVKGINNIYEFDCGLSSGWEYSVNGVFPNYGCSAYYPEEGDEIRFLYTCDLGADIGNEFKGE